jgi:hypothetical protein
VKKGRKSDDSRKISKNHRTHSKAPSANLRKQRSADSESNVVSSDEHELESSEDAEDAEDDEVREDNLLTICRYCWIPITKISVAGFGQCE